MDNSTLDVRPAFPSVLTHYYLTLALVLIHPNEWNLTCLKLLDRLCIDLIERDTAHFLQYLRCSQTHSIYK